MTEEISIIRAVGVPVLQSSRCLTKLLEKVEIINDSKEELIKTYGRWFRKSDVVVTILQNIERALKSISDITTKAKVGGLIFKILGGLTAIAGIFLKNPGISKLYKCMYLTGTAIEKGSTVANNVLNKHYCKKSKKKIDSLMKLTRELESRKNEYFKILTEYENLLDDLNENELQIFYDYVEQEDLKILQSDVDLLSAVHKAIPPIEEEMNHLKISDDVLNIPLLEFTFLPKIIELKDVLKSKEILSTKCKSVPIDKNDAETVTRVSNLKALYSDLLNIFGKSEEFKKNFAKIFFLVENIYDLITTISNSKDDSIQRKEVRRIAKELKQYRFDIREILNDTIKMD